MVTALSATALVGLGTAAVGAYGAYKSSKSAGSGGQTTQKTEIDPRLDPYLYGADGKGGLLGNANNLYQQQLLTGGLNPMQTAGQEMQRQALLSPDTSKLWDMQRQAGGALLGGGAAGNPFSQGMVGANGRVQQPKFNTAQIQQTLQQLPGTSIQDARQLASDRFGITGQQFDMATIGQRPAQQAPQVNFGAAATPIPQVAAAPAAAPMTEADIEALVLEYLKKNPLGTGAPAAWNPDTDRGTA